MSNFNEPMSATEFGLMQRGRIAEAHRRIEAELPEDEPDHVPDWVCELLINYGLQLGAILEAGRASVLIGKALAAQSETHDRTARDNFAALVEDLKLTIQRASIPVRATLSGHGRGRR